MGIRKYFIFSLSITLISFVLKSTAQSEFQHNFGSSQNEVAHDVHATSDGGFIVAGMSFATSGGSGLGAVLVKTDAAGVVEWTFSADSMSTTRYVVVVEDPSDQGFIVATCTANNWRSSGLSDYATLLFKVDKNGAKVWSKYIVGDEGDNYPGLKTKYDNVQSIRATSDGNFVIMGRSELNSYAVTDPEFGSIDMIVCKFNSAGTILGTYAVGTSTYDYGFTIEQCSDGDYVLYSYKGGVLSLTKIKANFSGITWSKSYNMGNTSYIPGGTYSAWGSIYATNSALIQTDDGGFVVTGYATSGTLGGEDFYVMKLKRDGTVSWAKRYGESGDESASGVVQLADGDLVVAGTTRSPALRANDRDMLLFRLDSSNGNIIWCKSYNEDVTGVQEYEAITCIALKGAGSIVVGGSVDYNGNCGSTDMSMTLMNASGAVSCSASGNLVMTDRTSVVLNATVTPTVSALTSVIEPVTSVIYNGGEYRSWALACNVEICATILPIQLTSFTGENSGNDNLLKWTTSSETNNDYFTIEKSEKAIDWEVLETIQGAGNSNSNLNYRFMDYSPHPKVTYYRLKQTDYDGQFAYSEIIAVKTNLDEVSIGNLYPNPAREEFSFNYHQLKGNLQLSIYSAQGVLVKEHFYSNIADVGKITVPVVQLANGLHFVDFNGAEVLKAFNSIEDINDEFIRTNCPNIYNGTIKIIEFINSITQNS